MFDISRNTMTIISYCKLKTWWRRKWIKEHLSFSISYKNVRKPVNWILKKSQLKFSRQVEFENIWQIGRGIVRTVLKISEVRSLLESDVHHYWYHDHFQGENVLLKFLKPSGRFLCQSVKYFQTLLVLRITVRVF